MGKLSDNHIAQELMDNHISDLYTNIIMDTSVNGRDSDGVLSIKTCPKVGTNTNKRTSTFKKSYVVDENMIMNASFHKRNSKFAFSICYNSKRISNELMTIIRDLKKNEKHNITIVERSLLYMSLMEHIFNYYGGCVKSNEVTFYPQDMVMLDYSVCEIKKQ